MHKHRWAWDTRRPTIVGIAVLALVAAVLAFTPQSATGAEEGGSPAATRDKIQQKLLNSFDKDPTRDFWIRLSERADLSAAKGMENWNARGQYVYKHLREVADRSQADLRELLASRDVTFKSYWISNAILVKDGTKQLALDVAASKSVEAVRAPTAYELIKPVKRQDSSRMSPNAVEWGIANINADDVWAQYGVTGEGITVASIDTGTQFDHPALVGKYRGNNGDGTFTHDYNWFDAAGNCSGAPCDLNGHGTHTMGTMVGDDGAGNQIGVAPGANWIEANGCCPSDQALVDSGEWFLAPTDLEGNNPDPTKRPNIINNSWGTTLPSNDPFMEDVIIAWEAAGIFGVFSNGNSGPSCQTSGAPGSRIVTYSVGAYDVNNNIAGFSARGPGQDGEIKPNISAPGVAVRSSLPGNSYGNFNGTSMAAPHVAGAIALLWSAAPAMVGDIDGTRALLDETAIDHEDLQCGGTADDNNVYGEGQLDALALLNAAPIGETGTLAGTVTDAATGDPIDGAQITITGSVNRNLTTGDDGTYSVLLPTGDYTVSVHAFGYADQTADVTITADTTTTQDFALEGVGRATISGRVTDGSGHGWPLYAKITVDGVPEGPYFTAPHNGRYSISLPAGTTYDFRVEPVYPGYEALTEEVTVGGTNVVKNFAVPVDQGTCTAPGYQFNYEGAGATFDDEALPDGWSVVDHINSGQAWQFDDPGGRGNLTGGSGGFAVVDSDAYGPGGTQDTSLVSPVMDFTDVTTPVIGFNQDYNNLSDVADVDLSLDGGASWQNVLRQNTDVRGPNQQLIEIPQAAGETDVQVRWHYYQASWEWWWEVDDIFIGLRSCDPIQGGLVVGHVRDQNTRSYVNGALVVSDNNPADRGRTAATPDDANLADGFYWLFSSLVGTNPFTASAGNYVSQTEDVDVDEDWTVRQNFNLAAGQLSVDPDSVQATVRLGRSAVRQFTVENTGSAPVDIELVEKRGGFVMLGADGSRTSRQAILESDGAPVKHISGTFSPLSHAAAGKNAFAPSATRTLPSADPWTNIADYPQDTMDAGATTVDGMLYSFGGYNGSDITGDSFVYDPASTSWSPIAALPDGRENPAVAAIDGLIYITGGWFPDGAVATSTLVYDPSADSYTEVAEQPVGVAAPGRVVLDGQLYLIGGCQAACGLSDVQHYDPGADSWETVADYPEDISHVACGAIGGMIYCAGGSAGSSTANGYVYDPGADAWSSIADLPIDLWGMAYTAANDMLLVSGGVTDGFATITNEGFAYDPGSDTWTELPNANYTVYRSGSACGLYRIGGSIGGFSPTSGVEVLPGMDECGEATDVEWLSVSPTTSSLQPGDSVTVRVTMDSETLAQPGTYSAGVQVKENTPYSAPVVDAILNVNPPRTWGKIAGTVQGVACDGTRTVLPGTTIQIDSWSGDWTLITEADGTYAYWIDRRANPLTVIAAKDGYKPQVKTVRLQSLATKTVNFNLQKRGC